MSYIDHNGQEGQSKWKWIIEIKHFLIFCVLDLTILLPKQVKNDIYPWSTEWVEAALKIALR